MIGVNMVFFIGGPQLGELEAGVVANWLGAPFSVISGGLGCMLAVAGVAAATPELRRYHAGTVTMTTAFDTEPVRTSQGEPSTSS